MATTEELLALSKKIAKKARLLIPRSANRRLFGVDDSQWAKKDIPTYLTLQITAQRSRGTQNKYRWVIDQLIEDNTMKTELTEKDIDKAFQRKLGQLGLDINDVYKELGSKQRSDKTKHKNNAKFLPFEQQEAAAKNAVRYRVGNCGENASLAYVMFAEYPGRQGDDTLPELDDVVDSRPLVEKIAATKADHAFVVVNRPAGDVTDVSRWLNKGDVIVCDPWWFHEGDALRTNDTSNEDKNDLLEFIEADAANLQVTGPAFRLGCGHSERYKAKAKYNNLNYYLNSIDTTIGTLRRPKWQPDSAVTQCPLCNSVFFSSGTLWKTPRKHHCRKCGRVVCDNCSQARRKVPFPATVDNEIPSPTTDEVRVCDTCKVNL